MSKYPNSNFNLPPGSVPHQLTVPFYAPNNLILDSIPGLVRPLTINTASSVFHSPDKNSMAELKFRAIQAQARNLAQVQKGLNLRNAADEAHVRIPQLKHSTPLAKQRHPPVTVQAGATLAMPPPGSQIPESLVRDILALIKKEYPWAESLLASKMSKEQFKLFLDKLPELKSIITSRMPVLPPSQVVAKSVGVAPPHVMQEVASAATAAVAAKTAAAMAKGPPEKDAPKPKFSLKFIELLFQIKKVTEVGLLDEDILDEPLSPMTMSMIHSMVRQVKKLADARRVLLAGKLQNPEDEVNILKRLLEMKEYIREEQKLYVESLKKKPEAERETVQQILKRL